MNILMRTKTKSLIIPWGRLCSCLSQEIWALQFLPNSSKEYYPHLANLILHGPAFSHRQEETGSSFWCCINHLIIFLLISSLIFFFCIILQLPGPIKATQICPNFAFFSMHFPMLPVHWDTKSCTSLFYLFCMNQYFCPLWWLIQSLHWF